MKPAMCAPVQVKRRPAQAEQPQTVGVNHQQSSVGESLRNCVSFNHVAPTVGYVLCLFVGLLSSEVQQHVSTGRQ